jgi:hypothetical protein
MRAARDPSPDGVDCNFCEVLRTVTCQYRGACRVCRRNSAALGRKLFVVRESRVIVFLPS